jgi:hypothetical protein
MFPQTTKTDKLTDPTLPRQTLIPLKILIALLHHTQKLRIIGFPVSEVVLWQDGELRALSSC